MQCSVVFRWERKKAHHRVTSDLGELRLDRVGSLKIFPFRLLVYVFGWNNVIIEIINC